MSLTLVVNNNNNNNNNDNNNNNNNNNNSEKHCQIIDIPISRGQWSKRKGEQEC